MTDPVTDAPDPAAQAANQAANLAAIAKVRRLMQLTMAATFAALAIILVIIGYRVFRSGERPPAADVTAVLPAGAKVISTALGEGRLAVTIEIDSATEIRLFALPGLRPEGRIHLRP